MSIPAIRCSFYLVCTGQSSRQTTTHPLGYGREIYFWSFVVAVMVFALGAGVSLYEGITHILNPEPIQNAAVNYVVLGLSVLFDGTTWWIALRNFKGQKNYSDLFSAIRNSKDPPSFMVLFEDSGSLIGLSLAFAGTYLSVRLDLPILDGVASILIGLVLAATAALLARETKGLLIGEAADQTHRGFHHPYRRGDGGRRACKWNHHGSSRARADRRRAQSGVRR